MISSSWYLGIDLGTTGLSASLLNRATKRVYPLYWKPEQKQDLSPILFRLPCVVEPLNSSESSGVALKDFKPYLSWAVPYVSVTQDNASEVSQVAVPQLQLSQFQTVDLSQCQQALEALLSTLSPQLHSRQNSVVLPQLYTCEALGLDLETLNSALEELAGVIIGCSSHQNEAYRYNLRCALLNTKLVKHPEQILIVEDAIATLLDQVSRCQLATLGKKPVSQLSSGGTLIINAGRTTTEIAAVDLPETLQNLTYSDWMCHSWDYGGWALDQDLICQLLLNHPTAKIPAFEAFQPSTIKWPQPGSPDLDQRYRLQYQLESSSLGQALLKAAQSLKVILQHKPDYTLTIDSYRWELQQSELERRVLMPFFNQFNPQLNHVIAQARLSTLAINQVICWGGNGTWLGLKRWLRQKLPNAMILQDYDSNAGQQVKGIATGLATIPLYFNTLDQPRHQYSDFFLLRELLRLFRDKPLSKMQVMQGLERQGINTRCCQSRIIALLKGQLPLGLVPSKSEWQLLHPTSQNHPDYQALREKTLFSQDQQQNYCLNQDQADFVLQYLTQLLSEYPQLLEEPLALNLSENN